MKIGIQGWGKGEWILAYARMTEGKRHGRSNYLTKSERFVQAFFQTKYGIQLLKIGESKDKSPDFQCIVDGERIFVYELKSIERVQRIEANGWKVTCSEGIREATRDDNSVNRVASKIHEAYNQLQSYTEPKVLIFLNEDSLDVKDLEEAFNGYHVYSNKDIVIVNTASKKIANGMIEPVKRRIDLYIWPNKRNGTDVFFRYPTQVGDDLVNAYFKR